MNEQPTPEAACFVYLKPGRFQRLMHHRLIWPWAGRILWWVVGKMGPSHIGRP